MCTKKICLVLGLILIFFNLIEDLSAQRKSLSSVGSSANKPTRTGSINLKRRTRTPRTTTQTTRTSTNKSTKTTSKKTKEIPKVEKVGVIVGEIAKGVVYGRSISADAIDVFEVSTLKFNPLKEGQKLPTVAVPQDYKYAVLSSGNVESYLLINDKVKLFFDGIVLMTINAVNPKDFIVNVKSGGFKIRPKTAKTSFDEVDSVWEGLNIKVIFNNGQGVFASNNFDFNLNQIHVKTGTAIFYEKKNFSFLAPGNRLNVLSDQAQPQISGYRMTNVKNNFNDLVGSTQLNDLIKGLHSASSAPNINTQFNDRITNSVLNEQALSLKIK